jgi:hypothetical protein
VRIINFSQGSVIPEGMGDGNSAYSNSTYGLVDLAVSGGALFVASAGNEGLTSWMGPTSDADADGWIEFVPGDEANSMDLSAGDEVFVGIRWASAGSDYDLSIWQGETQLAQSADFQSQTGDPAELIPFTAPSTGTYEISIRRESASAAPTMRLMVVAAAATMLTYRTTAGSLPTPADSHNPGLVTVGAVNYQSPTVVEPYSSRGPTFDGRVKPDLVAADCAPTVSLAVFCGTSEAAPFVSGAAALILESNPTLTPTQLAAYLRSHASPVGSPIPNNDSGHGLLTLGTLPGGLATQVAFLAPAATGTVGTPFLGQPVVGITDAAGELVKVGPASIAPVTLSVATNAGGGTLTCASGLTVAAVAGIARFNGCALDQPGSGYVLRADAAGLTGAVGAPFIVAAAGTPPSLSLVAAAVVVTYGSSLGLTGRAEPGGAGVLVETVRVVGGVDTEPRPATTDALGNATWAFKPIVNSDYRLRLVTPGTGIVEVSGPVRIRVNGTAVLSSSIRGGRTISRTTSIVITNTIRPIGVLAARGRARIDLFQRTSSGWTRRRTVYANADAAGRARATIRLPAAGSWWIRSRAEPTTTNGASPWTAGVKVTVR